MYAVFDMRTKCRAGHAVPRDDGGDQPLGGVGRGTKEPGRVAAFALSHDHADSGPAVPPDRHLREESEAPTRRGVRPGLAAIALRDQWVEVVDGAGDRQGDAFRLHDLAEDRVAHRLPKDA